MPVLRPLKKCPSCGVTLPTPDDSDALRKEVDRLEGILKERAQSVVRLSRALNERNEQEDAKREELSARAFAAERDAVDARSERDKARAELARFHGALTQYLDNLHAEKLPARGLDAVIAADAADPPNPKTDPVLAAIISAASDDDLQPALDRLEKKP